MMASELTLTVQQTEAKIAELKAGVVQKAKYIKYAVVGLLLVIFGPAILTGIIAGTAALIFGIVVFVLTQLAPYFGQYVANKRTELQIAEYTRHLEALKAAARKNPVETLQQVFSQQQRNLQAKSDKINKFATKVNKYGQKVGELKEKFPKDASTFDKVHCDMMLLLKKRREKWQESRDKLDQLGHEIERAEAIWDMTQATAELRESAGDLEEAFLAKVRTNTAFDAVQESLAASMADLDNLLMEEVDLSPMDKPAALENNPTPVLDIQDAKVKGFTTISREAISRRER